MLALTLKRLRENCGYTQWQVADALNIDRSTYAYYETGKTVPNINTIIKLSKIFNVSYTDILEQEEKNHSRSFSDINLHSKDYFKSNVCIYELSKMEKALISIYRLLPAKEQEDLLANLKDQVKDIGKDKLDL
ncbi:MAG: helix-turn-helix domain-containing protein [Clostridia bacterium]|nr:helix-turn-helix domain-containing protein [Clostridia bacterium]